MHELSVLQLHQCQASKQSHQEAFNHVHSRQSFYIWNATELPGMPWSQQAEVSLQAWPKASAAPLVGEGAGGVEAGEHTQCCF